MSTTLATLWLHIRNIRNWRLRCHRALLRPPHWKLPWKQSCARPECKAGYFSDLAYQLSVRARELKQRMEEDMAQRESEGGNP